MEEKILEFLKVAYSCGVADAIKIAHGSEGYPHSTPTMILDRIKDRTNKLTGLNQSVINIDKPQTVGTRPKGLPQNAPSSVDVSH